LPAAPSSPRGPANKTPDAVSAVSVAFAPGSSLGEFDKNQGSQDARYAYIVTAGNRFGESTSSAPFLSPILTAAQAAAGYEAQLTITNGLSLSRPPDYFIVYRTVALRATTTVAPANTGAYGEIFKTRAQSQANSGVTPLIPGTLTDTNKVMPFTEEIYVGELDPQVITFRQLAPLMKLDLSVMGPSYRWMILLYGVPILFASRKWCKITNVGRL